MKSLVILLFLLPLRLLSQDLPGVWVGILHNDTTELDLHYEIVISEHKGKLTGFSYTNFIVDGRSYTGVKSLIINKRFGKLYVEDDKLVYNNYDFEPPKGVKQASILEQSSVEEMLSGRFVTTRTKQYGKQVTGHIYLLKKNDLAVSKLMEILNGINMTAGLSFIPKEEVAAAPFIKPKETEEPVIKKEPVASTTSKEKEETKTTPPSVTKTKETEQPIVKKEIATSTTPVKEAVKTMPPPVTKPKEKELPVVKKENTTPVTTPVKEQPKVSAPVVKEVSKPTLQQQLATRRIETVQTIYFTSDSLVLELYDNGYVDGDTVSIVVNGKAFVTNIRLSEKASVRTIHITPDMGDSVNLVMFAENLGSISPNSGLAIIKDGKKAHSVAFSGDLQKNAAIILRRKKE